MKNKTYLITVSLLTVILVGSFVSAFGTSYIFERPLRLYPGQTKDIYVTLQNNGGPNDITATAQLTQDLEIAKLTDNTDTFFIPYKGSAQVNLSFTVPENAKIGETYRAKLRFIPEATEEQGMGLVFATGSNIDVLVVEEPKPEIPDDELKEETPGFMLLLFLGLLIVITAAILIILARKRFKK